MRARNIRPILLVAALAVAGCSDSDSDAGSVAGATFPAIKDAKVLALEINTLSNDPASRFRTVTGDDRTGADGVFRVRTGDLAGAFALQFEGGVYTEPGTLSPTAFTTGISPAGVPIHSLRALVVVGQGDDIGDVVVSPLSEIASTMALSLRSTSIYDIRALVEFCSDSLSLYYSANPGLARFTPGVDLWGPKAPTVTPTLTDPIIVGLLTVGLVRSAKTAGETLQDYLVAIGIDAADGFADGLVHARPSTPTGTPIVIDLRAISTYPADPLGDALADGIVAFLNSAENTSSVTVAQAVPFLDSIRARDGRLYFQTPFVAGVVPTGPPGSRTVRITGTGFAPGAIVVFESGGFGVNTSVASATEVTTDAPPGFVSGAAAFVTVINLDGTRHSRSATINLP